VTHISLNGHRTWTYVSKRKKKQSLVLLHGGMSSSGSLLRNLAPHFDKNYRIAAFDRRGHGRTADTDAPFHYEEMADETIAFLEHLGGKHYVVGHSDGGNVALIVAMRRPDLLKRVVIVGANYHYDGMRPMPMFHLEGEQFEEWATKYGELSPSGKEHARDVITKTLHMFDTEPAFSVDDLAKITVPMLVMAGDDDLMELSHTTSMYEAVPGAQLAIVPGTSHAVLKEKTKLSAKLIRNFFEDDYPPVTYQPSRRAQ
jgi:pimeloyl-ACP methyl ester carboxylesterase